MYWRSSITFFHGIGKLITVKLLSQLQQNNSPSHMSDFPKNAHVVLDALGLDRRETSLSFPIHPMWRLVKDHLHYIFSPKPSCFFSKYKISPKNMVGGFLNPSYPLTNFDHHPSNF